METTRFLLTLFLLSVFVAFASAVNDCTTAVTANDAPQITCPTDIAISASQVGCVLKASWNDPQFAANPIAATGLDWSNKNRAVFSSPNSNIGNWAVCYYGLNYAYGAACTAQSFVTTSSNPAWVTTSSFADWISNSPSQGGTGPSGFYKAKQKWGASATGGLFDFTSISVYIAMSSDNEIVDVRCDGNPVKAIPQGVGFGSTNVIQFPSIDNTVCTTFSYIEVIYYNAPIIGGGNNPEGIIIEIKGNPKLIAAPYYTDSCGPVTLVYQTTSYLSGISTFPIGTTALSYKATDQQGASTTCSFSVVMTNNAPIIINCNNPNYVFLNNNGTVVVVAEQLADIEYSCPQFALSMSRTTFYCSDVKTSPVSVTISASDILQSDSQTCFVNIIDNIPPILECRPTTVYLDNTGNVVLPPVNITAYTDDNCPGTTLSASPNAFTCANIGPNSVQLLAVDASSNSATCYSVVNVVDNIPPSITCQAASVSLNANGVATITSTNVVASSSDNCGTPSITFSQNAFTCDNLGSNNVITVTATDAAGNQKSCQATVTVTDTLGSTPTCQNVALYLNQNGVATFNPSSGVSSTTGGCSPLSYSASATSFACSSGPQTSSVTVTVKDLNGISNTCSSSVTVYDQIAPILTCKPVSLSLTSATPITFTPLSGISAVTDNCGNSSVSISSNVTSLGCSNIGKTYALITGTDAYSNQGSCVSVITLTETIPPVVNCKTGVQSVNLTSSYPGTFNFNPSSYASATATCGSVSLTGQKSYGCSNLGLNPTTVTATDSYGNVASCSVNINIVDGTNPSLSCLTSNTIYINNGTAPFNISNSVSSFSDNCGVSLSSTSPSNYSCSSIGNNPITVTATDPSGNIATCTSTVVVARKVTPSATCNSQLFLTLPKPNYTASINTSYIVKSNVDDCPIVSTVISPKINFTINDLAAQAYTVSVNYTDTQPLTFGCQTSMYVIVPLLDGLSNIREVHVGFLITWDNTVSKFTGQSVTFYYYNSAGTKVTINASPVPYKNGSYNWVSGFNQVNVNNYYDLYMVIGGVIADVFPIYVIA